MYYLFYRKKNLIKHVNEVRVVIDPNLTLEKQLDAINWFKKSIKADHYYLSPCEVEGKFNFDQLAPLYDQLKHDG